MRIIKFRGKTPDGIWVYGQYAGEFDNSNVGGFRGALILAPYATIVEPLTVGQFTVVTDKNGKEIWEDDVVRVGILSPNYTGSFPEPYYVDTICIYKEGAFLYKRISPFDKKKLSRNWTYKPMHRYEIYSTEVIGNIHDNPELLKGGIERL